ncbi:putative sodium-coupled neutral amino acid transporter 10 isoform X2 [Homarus americanus]|uniref:putative sodium-coupled neutral amino acid transporter 10 isoform X2 n=1 Tax=Homarus americanus TaxID=6706 RepID=UPI001C4594D9|nr:putative sodium-coupled neutral amino acid transporter 10 isoform X2 [Homarus americanus]
MAGNLKHVVNMANSIVGVSILSMPYCFKETGLVLGILLVLLSGVVTKKTCLFLVRSAIMARRRSYEFLAFHVFGVSGKLFVEVCMILFLVGICISFHVVMGDLAPAIVARLMNVENSPPLRCTLLIGIALLVVLPLCLLRNLDSLASMSACSIGFYFFLIFVIFWHAFPRLMDGSWYHVAELMRPSGALQVLPICVLGLSCQSNVFEIYDSIPDPDVPKMRSVVNQAVNLCCALYIMVGFLGYVAFVDQDLAGNLILNFPNSQLTEGIKVFFTVSLAISFPLMIFPCRTSIHSLLYRRNNPSSFDLVGNYMPEARFKGITLGILTTSLVVGILIPNIEFVLGLLGSTMGMLIALILPSILFIKVNSKASAERLLAQTIMLVGIVLIVTGTYLNLAHIYKVQAEQTEVVIANMIKNDLDPNLPNIEKQISKEGKAAEAVPAGGDSATRREPVAPEPPPEDLGIKKEDKRVLVDKDKVEAKETKGEKNNAHSLDKEESRKEVIEQRKLAEEKEEKNEGDTLHPDAIQKEEKVNKEEGNENRKEEEVDKKKAELLEKMEVQHKEQQQLLAVLQESKQILQELKVAKKEQDLKRQEEENRAAVIIPVPNVVPVEKSFAGNLAAGNPAAVGNLAAGNPAAVGNLVGVNPAAVGNLAAGNPAAIGVNPAAVGNLAAGNPAAVGNLVGVNPAVGNPAAVVNPAAMKPGTVNAAPIKLAPAIAIAGNSGGLGNMQNPVMGPAALRNTGVGQVDNLVNSALPAPQGNQVYNYQVIQAAGNNGGLPIYPNTGNQMVYQVPQASNVGGAPVGNEPVYAGNQPQPVVQVSNNKDQVPLVAGGVVAGIGAAAKEELAPPVQQVLPGNQPQNQVPVGEDPMKPKAEAPIVELQERVQETVKAQGPALQSQGKPQSRIEEPAKNVPDPARQKESPLGKSRDTAKEKDTKKSTSVSDNKNQVNVGQIRAPVSSSPNIKGMKDSQSINNNNSLSSKKNSKNKTNQKKINHGEDRRKRDVDENYLFNLPEVDLFKEIKSRDSIDVAYDTRHLLWNSRSRRKRRRNDRERDDYYWDET